MNKGGQPTKYKPEYDRQVFRFALLGATDDEIADFYEVHVDTITNWKKAHPSFFASLKRGKLEADGKVTKSLYQRAKGYSHFEDKIFNNNGIPLVVPTIKHYAPDTTACIFWLKNRQSAKWRDKRDIEIMKRMSDMDKQEIEREIAELESDLNITD